jgi:hypothetical protein
VVTVEKLPTQLVEMFAEAASGLLSNAALRGLTALRDGAPAVLRAFGPSIDPGFLAHRLLLPRPSDAEDQAVALLAAEFGAMLESAGIEAEVNREAIAAWLNEQGITSDAQITAALWDSVFKPSVGSGRFDAVVSALDVGISASLANGRRFFLQKDGFRSAAADLFTTTGADGALANARFAHLMSIASRYRSDAPALGLGTICEGEDQVWISMQPACDSVRLRGPVDFPTVPLKEVTDDGEFALVVIDRGLPRFFNLPTKFRDVRMRTFQPDSSRGEVVADATDGDWEFKDQGGQSHRWVGMLREQHAQRLVRRFAERLSRLGLEESEWLRRSSRSSGDEG